MQFFSVISSEARNLKSETGLHATISVPHCVRNDMISVYGQMSTQPKQGQRYVRTIRLIRGIRPPGRAVRLRFVDDGRCLYPALEHPTDCAGADRAICRREYGRHLPPEHRQPAAMGHDRRAQSEEQGQRASIVQRARGDGARVAFVPTVIRGAALVSYLPTDSTSGAKTRPVIGRRSGFTARTTRR